VNKCNAVRFFGRYSRKEHDAGVRHGVGQAQDAAPHDGVAQVEHGHPEGGVAGMLLGERKESGRER